MTGKDPRADESEVIEELLKKGSATATTVLPNTGNTVLHELGEFDPAVVGRPIKAVLTWLRNLEGSGPQH